jgi:hypothetical protein
LSILDGNYFNAITNFNVGINEDKLKHGFPVNINAHKADPKDFKKLVSYSVSVQVKPVEDRPLVTEEDRYIWPEQSTKSFQRRAGNRNC